MRAKQCVRHGWNRREFCAAAAGATVLAAAAPGVLAADKDSGAIGLRDVRALSDTSEHIQRLARRVRGFPPREICFERARLMTESYRRTAGAPAIVRKAQAFYAVADGLPLQIEPGEWLVGNIASRPRVAYFAPESYDWSQFRPGTEQVLKSDLVRGKTSASTFPKTSRLFGGRCRRETRRATFFPFSQAEQAASCRRP